MIFMGRKLPREMFGHLKRFISYGPGKCHLYETLCQTDNECLGSPLYVDEDDIKTNSSELWCELGIVSL